MRWELLSLVEEMSFLLYRTGYLDVRAAVIMRRVVNTEG